MALDADDEILQDFLVEAGEILEQLGEQLVDLERRPTDEDLLHAVFRSFHTIKGGAGFIGLDALVEVCHRAEDVFNILRQGQRTADAHLMDVVLRALDVINGMMAQVRNGEEPEHADSALLRDLEALQSPQGSDEVAAAPSGQTPTEPQEATQGGDAAERAFDAMVEESQPESAGAASTSQDDEITEDEFESLLDELHGPGQHQGAPAAGQASVEQVPTADKADQPAAAQAVSAPAQPAATLDKASKAEPAPSQGEPERDNKGDPGGGAKGKEGGQAQAESSVRVDTKRLDDIMNLVGELVLVRNRLSTLKSSMGDDEASKAVANLDLVTADLQSAVMKTRMQPIKKVFSRFPRVIRDLSRNLGKDINLELYGEETDLDKNLVEALADPLVHLVRNAVDHGIESGDEREAQGKPRAGQVTLKAEQEGDHILLVIEDDGAGMDAEKIKAKAIENGVIDADQAARLDPREAYDLIFAPGFSTKAEISDVSGRGVGMDVVKTRINQLNGSIEVDSEKGRGSRFLIKLPLTLAIVPTLMVTLGSRTFALPLGNVSEIIHLDTIHSNTVDGRLVVIVREHTLPLVYLGEWLVSHHEAYERPSGGYVVIVRIGTQNVACVVDQLIGQEEVVIKPLGALLQGTRGLAGATITGDGRIALILDMPDLMVSYSHRL